MQKMKIATLAAVSVLGLGAIGGAAVKANATTSPAKSATPPVVSTASANNEATGLPDTDNVQQGDQTSPDAATLASSQTATGSEQQAAENSTEASSEKAGVESDGPGGHADPAGVNVDHQFEGVE